MANKKYENSVWLGTDNMLEEYHPTAVKGFPFITRFSPTKTVNQLTLKNPQVFMGIDIETNLNGDMMLLGWSETNPRSGRNHYDYAYRGDVGAVGLLERLYRLVRYCFTAKFSEGSEVMAMVYWNTFEPQTILRLFWEVMGIFENEDEEQAVAIARRWDISSSGSYDKKTGMWANPPIVSYTFENGVEFGINKVVNDCVEFYYLTDKQKEKQVQLSTVNLFDASKLWTKSLEKASDDHLNWGYEKFGRQYHVINWERFDKHYVPNTEAIKQPNNFVRNCLKSNMYDCYAVKDLHEIIRDMFVEEFGVHPRYYYSAGSLTDIAIALYMTPELQRRLPIVSCLDEWQRQGVSAEVRKKIIDLATDSYNAALIELMQKGFFKNVGYLDITASYPAIMRSLLDIYGAKVTYGTGTPPKQTKNDYLFVTAQFNIQYRDYISTVTVREASDSKKHRDQQRLRGMGPFTTTVLWEEIEFLNRQAKKLGREEVVEEYIEWVLIETEGNTTPYENVVNILTAKRMDLHKKGSENEYVVKTTTNSIYGKTIQTVPEWEEREDEGIVFKGHKAGSYFNIIYSSIICSYARLRLAEMELHIKEKANEDVGITLMTDAIIFDMGKETNPLKFVDQEFDSILAHRKGLEKNGWSEEKTIGLFSKPEHFQNAFFLNTMIFELQNPQTKEYDIRMMGFRVDARKEIEEEFVKFFERYPTDDEVEEEFQKRLGKSYLYEKAKLISKYPKKFMVKSGKDGGEIAMPVFHKQLITVNQIAVGVKSYLQLGQIRTDERHLLVEPFEPKRVGIGYDKLGHEVDKSYFSWEEITYNKVKSKPIDLIKYAKIEGDGTSFFKGKRTYLDNRLLYVHGLYEITDKPEKELITLVIEKKKSSKTTDYDLNDVRKTLTKQIKENIQLFPFDNFGAKAGSFGGMNIRDYGVDNARELIKSVGLEPLV